MPPTVVPLLHPLKHLAAAMLRLLRHRSANSLLVLENDVEGMNDPRNKAQQSQQDVQPKLSFKADLKEYAKGWQDDGKKNLD